MREVLEKYDFDNTLNRVNEAGLLFQVLERFKNVDLHPERVDNSTMGTIFEELIRKFNKAVNEHPGEHFAPRDVVHLMVDCGSRSYGSGCSHSPTRKHQHDVQRDVHLVRITLLRVWVPPFPHAQARAWPWGSLHLV